MAERVWDNFLEGSLIFIILYLPSWYLRYRICLETSVILCISSCPSHSSLLGTANARFPVLWRAPVMWENNDTNHMKFYPISYRLRWNGCSLWGRNTFLCWLLYIGLAPQRKMPPLTHGASEEAMQVSHAASSFLSLVLWSWCCMRWRMFLFDVTGFRDGSVSVLGVKLSACFTEEATEGNKELV